jgi:PD-(D/E)XK nuclease superfamily
VKQVILRTSERRAFKRCVAKWFWAYRRGLKPKGAEKTPLWFGTGVHYALAEWYLPGKKRGPHPAETFEKFAGDAVVAIKTADADEEQVAQYVDGKQLGIAMLEGYVKKYGRDEQWSFISAEQAFDIDVPWPGGDRQVLWIVEEGQIMLRYAGTFDGVYRDLSTDRIELLETKTAKAIQTSHLPLDDQAGSYWAVASHTLAKQGLIKQGERISGINYNFLRKALPDDRPRDEQGYATNKPIKQHYILALDGIDGWTAKELGKKKLDELDSIAAAHHMLVLGDRSKSQPLPLFHREIVHRTSAERRTQLERIQNEALHMQAVREGLLPIIKNPTRDCVWDCDFYNMCELQERGGAWKDHMEVAYRVEDPYADHRKSTDE